jgi:hypothetical protein
MFRIWPGSHRLLLWGDPSSAAAHARTFNFCGSDGGELFEPISFKGRRGSGIPGSRCAYADTSLNPQWDWQKYQSNVHGKSHAGFLADNTAWGFLRCALLLVVHRE